MRETRTLLNALGSVATVNFENPACLSVLDEVVSDSEVYENIVIARADGTIVCYGRPDPEPVDPEAEPYATTLATGEFAIGDYQAGDAETPPHIMTAVATKTRLVPTSSRHNCRSNASPHSSRRSACPRISRCSR